MTCPELTISTTPDWDEITETFCCGLVWEFTQAWLPHHESRFLPGRVKLGWHSDRLLFFAHLRDADVRTSATSRNQPLWELGDVLEIFAGIKGEQAYIEHHTAPNGVILQLQWPDGRSLAQVKDTGLGPFLVNDDDSVSRTRLVEGGWQVYGEVPVSALSPSAAPLRGQVWQVNLGRYDHHDDGTFTLSSTSPLTAPSYHRRHEWREIEFK